MAKRLPKFGVNLYTKKTAKKRPGRHAKSYGKRIPRRKKSRGQGRRKQCFFSIDIWNHITYNVGYKRKVK